MKFRISNPFRVIATLRTELADARYEAANLADQLLFVRARRDYLSQSVSVLAAALTVADQAVDEHMQDREGLSQAVDAFMDEREETAADIVTTVAWVRQVEQTLADAGIAIVDHPEGPMIVVEQVKIIDAIRGSTQTQPGFNLLRRPTPLLAA